MRSLLVVTLALASTSSIAAPDPFGMEMTKSCKKQLEDRDSEMKGFNKHSVGPQYDVSTSNIDFRDLNGITAICNSEGELVGVLAKLQKQMGGGTFDRLIEMLRSKYKTVDINNAHVGSKSAEFRSGNVVIKVNEPHMSHTTKLTYLTDSFKSKVEKNARQEEQKQKQKESGAL